jgi:hypothetical protein
MVPVALVADAIRHAEARADIGRRVVAGARVGGVDGIRDALRSGLLEPEIDLLPPVAIDHNVAAVAGRSDRGRIPLSSHDGSPLAIVELPQGKVDPPVVDAALAAARVGLEHADAVERLRMRIDELKASRSEFLTTFERERRRLKIQLSSGSAATWSKSGAGRRRWNVSVIPSGDISTARSKAACCAGVAA